MSHVHNWVFARFGEREIMPLILMVGVRQVIRHVKRTTSKVASEFFGGSLANPCKAENVY